MAEKEAAKAKHYEWLVHLENNQLEQELMEIVSNFFILFFRYPEN